MSKEKSTSEEQLKSIADIEGHSYSNPLGNVEFKMDEYAFLKLVKDKLKQQAATLDIIEENGQRFAVVKNVLDGKIIFKSSQPSDIDKLFDKSNL